MIIDQSIFIVWIHFVVPLNINMFFKLTQSFNDKYSNNKEEENTINCDKCFIAIISFCVQNQSRRERDKFSVVRGTYGLYQPLGCGSGSGFGSGFRLGEHMVYTIGWGVNLDPGLDPVLG